LETCWKNRGNVKDNHDLIHNNDDKDKDHHAMVMDAGKMDEKEWTAKHGSNLHSKYKQVHEYLHKEKESKPTEEKKEDTYKEPPPIGEGHYKSKNEEGRAYKLAQGFKWNGEDWVHPDYPGKSVFSSDVPKPKKEDVLRELAKIRGEKPAEVMVGNQPVPFYPVNAAAVKQVLSEKGIKAKWCRQSGMALNLVIDKNDKEKAGQILDALSMVDILGRKASASAPVSSSGDAYQYTFYRTDKQPETDPTEPKKEQPKEEPAAEAPKKKTFDEFSEELDKPKDEDIHDMEIAILTLKQKYDKLNGTSTTPYGDELARSFPMARVGFQSGKLAKIRDRELERTIQNASNSIKIEQELKWLETRLKNYKAGKVHANGQSKIMPVKKLQGVIAAGENGLKSGKLGGQDLTDEDKRNLKDSISDFKKKLSKKLKEHKAKYEEYLKG
jgi:hypothetical protein